MRNLGIYALILGLYFTLGVRSFGAAADFSMGIRGSKIRVDGFSKDTESGRGFFVRQRFSERWMVETSCDFYTFHFSERWGISEKSIVELPILTIRNGFVISEMVQLPIIPDDRFDLFGSIDSVMVWMTVYYFLQNSDDFKLFVGAGLNYMSTDYQYKKHEFIYYTYQQVPVEGWEFLFPTFFEYEALENKIELSDHVSSKIDDKLSPHVGIGMDYSITKHFKVTSSLLYRFDEGRKESKYSSSVRNFIESFNFRSTTPGITEINLSGWSANLGLELNF